MMYKQKLTKIGNSVGVVLPKAILDSLGLKQGNKVCIEEIQGHLILSIGEYKSPSPTFMKVAEEVADEYSDIFEELAKQ